jgi:hypothetical protein
LLKIFFIVDANRMTGYIVISIIILSIALATYSLLPIPSPSSAVSLSINVPTSTHSSPYHPSSPQAVLSGIISSLILDVPQSTNPFDSNNDNTSQYNITNIQKFILAGDWNIQLEEIINNNTDNKRENTVKNLKVINLTAEFLGISKDGKGDHYHQISNFKPIQTHNLTKNSLGNGFKNNDGVPFYPMPNILTPSGNAKILGTVDVGINGNVIWENVNANITISEGKTIEIFLAEKDVDHHFGQGQSIYGLVNRLSIVQ